MVDTDAAWEEIARRDPFWGVLSTDEYLGTDLGEETERSFFQSGEDHVSRVFDVLRQHVQPGFSPVSALDYGCGLGRILIPLAKACERVIGVDVSPTMLSRAAANLTRANVTNVELVQANHVPPIAPPVEFVHSALVLQHVHPSRGLAIVEELLSVLAPGGCGAVQFHLRGSSSHLLRLSRRLRERSQVASNLLVRLRGGDSREALVLMYPYDSTSILRILAAMGARNVYAETEAQPNGHTDATFFFQKSR
jgi:SAM-dependent methyltransferase